VGQVAALPKGRHLAKAIPKRDTCTAQKNPASQKREAGCHRYGTQQC
jgi:hypothetical protein